MSRSWVDVLIFYVLLFGVVYLAWCNFVMDLTSSVYKILCKSGKNVMETLAMIREALREESMSYTRVFEWHAWFWVDRKWQDR
jgi:hypothetical protein